MNLALTMSDCQQNKKLVSQVRLILDSLNRYNFSVNADRPKWFHDLVTPHGLDGEVITADNGIDRVDITFIADSVYMYRHQYDDDGNLIRVGYLTPVTHYMEVFQALLPDYMWDKVADSASDYVQDSTTENLELFTLVAIAQLL